MTAHDDGLREAALAVYHGKIGYDHPTDPTILALGAVLFPDRAAIRSEYAAPTCCELACYEDPGCACDGCRSEDAAPQPDPCSHGFSGEPCEVHRHLWAVAEPCRDGEHASCPGRDEDGNECGCLCGHVGETAHSSPAAAPQPDTALTVERLSKAMAQGRSAAFDARFEHPEAWYVLRALGEGVES